MEGLSITKISYKAGKWPKKAKHSGSGNYCCVPNCKRMQYKVDKKVKMKTGFFFIFQKLQKEESNGFKAYPDLDKEERKTNSM